MYSVIKHLTSKVSQPAKPKTTNFHGAAIIDAQGREIPITENMIQDALQSITDLMPVQRAKLHYMR